MNPLKVTTLVIFSVFIGLDVYGQTEIQPSPLQQTPTQSPLTQRIRPVMPTILSREKCAEICNRSSLLKLIGPEQKDLLKECTMQKYCSELTGVTAGAPDSAGINVGIEADVESVREGSAYKNKIEKSYELMKNFGYSK